MGFLFVCTREQVHMWSYLSNLRHWIRKLWALVRKVIFSLVYFIFISLHLILVVEFMSLHLILPEKSTCEFYIGKDINFISLHSKANVWIVAPPQHSAWWFMANLQKRYNFLYKKKATGGLAKRSFYCTI